MQHCRSRPMMHPVKQHTHRVTACDVINGVTQLAALLSCDLQQASPEEVGTSAHAHNHNLQAGAHVLLLSCECLNRYCPQTSCLHCCTTHVCKRC
jgi:hypothetical protein